jgi:maleate isomerase
MNVQSRSFTPIFDEGRHPRGKLGFVLLATEQTVQDDMITLCPDGVGVHFARVQNPDEITKETLAAIAPELTRASATLLPDGSLDVVSYACTSGSLVLGQERVEELLRAGNPGAKPSSIIAAVIRALHAVAAHRIVVATPYLDEINTAEREYLAARGFDVLDIQGLNLTRDSDMVRVAPAYLADMAAGLDRSEADAIFISCGALRSIDIIDRLEQRTGKSVITSNQALGWDALRLAGIEDRKPGFGTLFDAH